MKKVSSSGMLKINTDFFFLIFITKVLFDFLTFLLCLLDFTKEKSIKLLNFCLNNEPSLIKKIEGKHRKIENTI